MCHSALYLSPMDLINAHIQTHTHTCNHILTAVPCNRQLLPVLLRITRLFYLEIRAPLDMVAMERAPHFSVSIRLSPSVYLTLCLGSLLISNKKILRDNSKLVKTCAHMLCVVVQQCVFVSVDKGKKRRSYGNSIWWLTCCLSKRFTDSLFGWRESHKVKGEGSFFGTDSWMLIVTRAYSSGTEVFNYISLVELKNVWEDQRKGKSWLHTYKALQTKVAFSRV